MCRPPLINNRQHEPQESGDKKVKSVQELKGKNMSITRNCTQQDLRLAELCLLSGVDDVTHHGQLTASTQLKQQNVQHETHKEHRKNRLLLEEGRADIAVIIFY